MPDLEAGAGQAEITPPVGCPLSGFIARQNQPSTGVDTPLFVRVLALRHPGRVSFLFSYELLGISKDLEEHILNRLESGLGEIFHREDCLLTATHNHSGPPTGLLLGEAAPDPRYLEFLADRSLSAARQALAALHPARLFAAERRLSSLTYNRRALLPDGRVSISPVPDLPVVRRGPVDDRLTVLLWRDLNGHNLAALVHYACHGVAVLSQRIGSDIPGALAVEIGAQLGVPCLFLQGAAGDINPTTVTAGPADLRLWIESALPHLRDLDSSLYPFQDGFFRTSSRPFSLEFAPLPSTQAAERLVQDFARIAAGDLDSPGLQETLRSFKNTMNLPPEAPLDPLQAGFVARVLAEHAGRVLAVSRSGEALPALPVRLCAWRLGEVGLVFLPAEIFASTGLKIRLLSCKRTVLPVSYASPLVGYLPDEEALAQGGYEVADAWRFYGQPAPFVQSSETRLVETAAGLIHELDH